MQWWTFPEWMKKYLDYLPNMVGEYYTKEKQIEWITKYMNYMDVEEVPPGTGMYKRLWYLVHHKVQLLQMLYIDGLLK